MQLRGPSSSPYSPDLAPSDIYLFLNLEANFRRRNLGSNESVVDAVDEYLGDQGEGFCSKGIS